MIVSYAPLAGRKQKFGFEIPLTLAFKELTFLDRRKMRMTPRN